MSVREATNIPNANVPNPSGPSSVNSDTTDSTDSSRTDASTETAQPTTTSFWDQQRNFQAKQDSKRRAIDKTIGDKTVDAASPLDSEGGKKVGAAAGKAGMTVPSKQTLGKVSHAVKDNPKMAQLEKYISDGLKGDPNFMTSSGVATAQNMAASIAQDAGLLDSKTAQAFGVSTSSTTSAASGQTNQMGGPSTANASTLASVAAGGGALSSTAALTQKLSQATTLSAQGSTLGAGTTSTSDTTDATTSDVTGSGNSATASATSTAASTATSTSSPSWLSGANISAIVLLACSASMNEDNKIKAGRLNDMQKFNHISSLISDYISNTLQPAQAALDKKTEGQKSDKASQARVSVDVWSGVDADDLFQDKSGNFGLSKTVTTQRLSNTGLSTELSAAQGWAQTASNNSEQASNRFQATDNQTNQTFTMLTGFLKAINDSNSSIIRNYA